MQRAQTLGWGGQCWVGYKQDLRPCQLGLMLAVEPCFSVFQEPRPVPEYCEAVLSKNDRNPYRLPNNGPMSPRDIREVERSLKGLTVSHPSPHRLFCPLPPLSLCVLCSGVLLVFARFGTL